MPKPHHAATAGGPVAGKTQCRKGVAPSWLAKGSIFHREQRAHMAQQLVIASHCSVLLSYSHASSRACLLAHLERGNQLEVLQHPPPGPCHTHILQAFPKVPSPKANYLQPTWHNPTAPTLHGHAVAALAQVVSGNGIQKWLLATLCNTLSEQGLSMANLVLGLVSPVLHHTGYPIGHALVQMLQHGQGHCSKLLMECFLELLKGLAPQTIHLGLHITPKILNQVEVWRIGRALWQETNAG